MRPGQPIVIFICLFGSIATALADSRDLTQTTVLIRAGELPAAEKIAATILVEEVERRTGIRWKITTELPTGADPVIAIATVRDKPVWHAQFSAPENGPKAAAKAEAFAIREVPTSGPRRLIIEGRDPRGAMFGVGKLLRSLDYQPGKVSTSQPITVAEAPDRPLRGHQIGYRDTANSWDAWTFDQFDQYFRDMVIFGANTVENIPFHDSRRPRVMKYKREEMNAKFAELCEKYDLDHWIWVPVEVKLPNQEKERKFLEAQETFYRSVKRLDAVFIPGGDPGDNKAVDLLPHLERLSALVRKYHPHAKIWLSLQHFKKDDIDLTFDFLTEKKPDWFGGLVMGPGSPPMESTRQRLPKAYQLRWYPDITHIIRCQYPVPWLDPALGETLGREPVSPRPVDMTQIYQMDYAFTDGFLTYSDGVHDDFNKNLWTQLGWNPHRHPREIARDYARFFFHSNTADKGADGLFALENDMRGDLSENGSVGATLLLWQDLERQILKPSSPWRFHMHVFRAYYDDYTRARLLYEQDLEQRALNQLDNDLRASVSIKPGNDAQNSAQNAVPQAIAKARDILSQATTNPVLPETRAKLFAFGDQLFAEVGLQTSVPKYDASGYERGAVLDFVDYPLNNRWWLEDQFDKMAQMKDVAEQVRRFEIIRDWENPGEGGYYDVLGHVGRSPRVVKLMNAGDMMRNTSTFTAPTQRWMGEKRIPLRQAWHAYLDEFPGGITYNNLDPAAHYVVKLFAQRTSPLVIDGARAQLIKSGETFDKVTEQIFDVPVEAVQDGRIKLTWDVLPDEATMNWRQRHYVTDIWVMKAAK